MRKVSLFSISILSLSIWGLFFTIFLLSDNSVHETEIDAKDIQIENKQIEDSKLIVKHSQAEEKARNYETSVKDEATSEVEIQETSESESVPATETVPKTLEERASSHYNDILYDFEKEHPISIDDLLDLVSLN